VAAACGLALTLAPVEAKAQASTWSGTVSSDWNTANNWLPSGVPGGTVGTTATALFDTSANTTVAIGSAGAYVQGITFTSNATTPYTITVNSGGSAGIAGGSITNNSGVMQNIQVNGDSSSLNFLGGTLTGPVQFTSIASLGPGQTGGIITFSQNASTGDATFLVQGGSTPNASGGNLQFYDGNAGSSIIVVDGGSATNAAGGGLVVRQASSGGTASIDIEGGTNGGNGGLARIIESSDLSTATVTTNGNGKFDVSGNGNTSIGSISGSGIYQLGSNILTVGGSDVASATVSGVIQDGGNGGSLVKTGSGILILSGANTYTGSTTVNGGTLSLGTGIAAGSLASGSKIGVNSGATLAIANVAGAILANNISNGVGGVGTVNMIQDEKIITLTGAITDGAAGQISLTQNGTGVTVLANSGNTFSGGIAVNTGTLQIGGSVSGSDVAGSLNPASTISLGGSGALDVYDVAGANFANAITAANNATLNITSPTTVTLSGKITSGSSNLIVNVLGNAILANSGTHYFGTTTVQPGAVLQLGTVQTATGIGLTALVVDGGGKLVFTNAGSSLGQGISGGGSSGGMSGVVEVNGSSNFSFLGTLQDGAAPLSLQQTGSGTTTLLGSNTYTGQTLVSAGALAVTGSIGGSTVNITGGTLMGTGNIGGTVDLSGGLLLPGSASVSGKLTIGTLNLSSGISEFRLGQVGASSNDQVIVTNSLSLGGTLTVVPQSGFSVGTYTLYQYGPSVTGNFSSVNGLAGYQATVSEATPNEMQLVVSYLGTAQYWAGGSGTWSTSTNNWANSSGGTANAAWAGGTAIFASPGGTVTLTSPISAQALLFNSGSYTLAGVQTLTLAGTTPGIIDSGNDVTIGVPLAGSKGLNVSGSGNVFLTNKANSYTGGTTVTGLTLQVGTTPQIGSLGSGTVSVGNGGTLSIVNLPSPTVSNNITNGIGGSATVETSFNNFTFTGTLTDGASGQLGFEGSVGKTVILANANNTFSGPTEVDQSTLQVGSAGTPGSIGPKSDISITVGGFLNLVDVAGNVFDNNINGPGLTGTVTISSASATTLSGAITGAIAITQSGAGTTTLTNTDPYTSATTVSTGNLQIGNGTSGNLTGNSTVTVSNTSTLILDQPGGSTMKATIALNGSGTTLRTTQSGNIAINGVISGTGEFLQAGSGTTELLSAETYTGPTDVTAGTLQVDTSLAAGSTVNIGTNGTLTGAGTIGGNVTVTGSGTINLSSGTVSGTLTSTGGNWNGIGTVNGAVTANSGTFTLANGATLTAKAGLDIAGGMLAGTGTLVGNLTYTSASTSTFSGLIKDGATPSTVTVNDSAAVLIFTTANTYTGVTNVTAGTLQVNNLLESSTVNIGSAGKLTGSGEIDGSVTMTGNGVINSSAGGFIEDNLTITGGNWNGLGAVQSAVTASSGTFTIGSAGNLTALDGVTISGGSLAGTGTITGSVVYTSSANSTFGGVIADGATDSSLTLNKASVTLTLTGANTYTGATTVTAGTLQIGNGTAGNLSASTSVDVQTGTLVTDLASNATFAPSVSLDSVNSVFNAIQSGTNTISGVISGAGGFNQNGTGTTILNAADTYTGPTNVNKGTLQIGDGTNGNLTNSSGVAVAAGATFALNLPDGTIFYPNIALNGATATFKAIQSTGTTQVNGVISGAGTVDQIGVGTTELIAAQTYTGPTNITGGDLQVDTSLAAASAVTVGTAGTLSGAGTINGKVTMTGNGIINLNSGTLASTLTVTGGNWNGVGTVDGVITSSLGVFNIGVGASMTGNAGMNITGGTIAGTGMIMANVNYTSSASSTFAGDICGTSTLLMNNAAATLTLTGPVSSTNTFTVAAGTLQLAAGGTTSFSSGIVVNGTGVFELSLSDTGTFDTPVSLNAAGASFKAGNASGTQTISSVISGSGSFSQIGAGTTVIASTVNETYTGATNITAGTLEVDGSLAALSIVNVGTAGTLSGGGIVNGKVTLTGNGTIDLAGGILGSTLAITGGNWSGAGTVNGAVTSTNGAFNLTGTLTAPAGLSVSGGTITSNGGTGVLAGNLTYTSTAASTFAGVVENGTNNSSLTVNNASASLTLTGANTYTGATTISAGLLQIGNGTSGNLSGTGLVTVSGSGALALDLGSGSPTFANNVLLNGATTSFRAVDPVGNMQAISGIISGVGAFDQNGAGTTTISGAQLYTGPTNVNAGTLVVLGSLASSIVNVAAGELGGTGIIHGNATLTGNGTIELGGGGTIDGTLAITGGNWLGGGTVDGVVTSSSGAFNLEGVLTAPDGLNVTGGTLTGTGELAGNLNYTSSLTSTFGGAVADGSATSSLTMNKTGATLILTGTNTYGGPTTILAGTLQLGDGITPNSSLGAGSVTVSGTGVLALDLPDKSTFGQSVSLSATGSTFKAIQSGKTTVSSAISGAGGFTQAGIGTTVFTGKGTYSGPTNVTAGTLQVDGALSGSGAVTVASGGTLSGAVSTTGTGSITGAVTVLSGGTLSPGDSGPNPGTLDLTKLTLSAGSNSNFRLNNPGTIGGGVNDLVAVSGNLTIAGNLNVTQLMNFGVGSYTLFTYNGTLTNTGFTAINGIGGFDAVISTGTAHQVNLVISTSTTQYWDGTGTTSNGVISGGSGTWNGANTNWSGASGLNNSTWAGGTAVFQTVGGTVTLGAPTNVQGLIFGVTGYTLTGAATAPLNLVGNAAGAGVPTISVSNSGTNATIAAIIGGNAGISADGAGTLILTNAANTYTGGTLIKTGTVQIGTSSAPGSLGAGVVTFDGSGTLDIVNIHNNLLSNSVTNSGTGNSVLEINSTLNNTISGPLTDGGGGSSLVLQQSGTGTTIVTNANNNYSGGTIVSKGTLQIGTTGASGLAGSLGGDSVFVLPGATLALVNVSGGTLNDAISGSKATSGSGLINVDSAQTLTLGGAIADGTTGLLALTQSGTGTTILTNANSYSGATTVSAGTLQVGDGLAVGVTLGSTTVTVTGSGSLALDLASNESLANAVALNSATAALKAISSNTQTISGVISGTGSLNQNGSGTTILSSGVTETYTGATNVNAGTLEVDGTLAAGSTVHVASGASLTGNGTIKGNATLTGAGTIALGSNGVIGGTLAVTSGNWNEDGTVTGAVTSSLGTFTIGSTADLTAKGGLNVTGGTLAGTGEVDGKLTDTSSTSFTFAGIIGNGTVTGAVVMNKASTTLTLTGENTYTGTTTVTAGTLQVGDGTTKNATLGSGAVTIASGATLSVDLASSEIFSNPITDTGHLVDNSSAGNNFTIASNISGAGNFTKSGSNTITLTGNNTYSGGTTVSAGTLLVNSTTGTGTVTIGSGGTLGGGGKATGVTTLGSGGTIAPGAGTTSANTALRGSSLLWNGGGTITLELGATTGDELNLTGALTKGTAGSFTIDLLNESIASQTSYTLMTFASTTFSLSNFTVEWPTGFNGMLVETSTSLSIADLAPVVGELPAGGTLDVANDSSESAPTASFNPSDESGPSITTSSSPDQSRADLIPTPEPGSAAFLAFGGITLLGWRRRRAVK
jgi:autotransporter-associated beta strand protein